MNRLFAFLLIFAPAILCAQSFPSLNLDSALYELYSTHNHNKQDTAKVLLLNLIARQYVRINADSATFFAGEGLKLAEKSGYLHGEMICLLTLGFSQLAHNFNTGLEYNFRALKIAEQTKNNLDLALALDGVGGCYHNLTKYTEAIDYYRKAITYFELAGENKLAIADNNLAIGDAYAQMGDIRKGIDYNALALKYYEQTGNVRQTALVYDNFGVWYSALGEYSKALEYSFKSLRLRRSLGIEVDCADPLNGIGEVYLRIGTDSAYVIHPDSLMQPTKKENIAKAISYLTQSLQLNREKRNVPLYAISDLVRALKANGNYKEALSVMEEYNKRKDSLESNDINIKIAHQETRRQTELRDLALKQKQNEQRFYIGGSILLLMLVVVVFRNYHKQKKLNGKLAISMEKQEHLLVQKDMLMKEIHHRVKNNLQVISTLLDLQLDNIKDAHAQKAITEGMSRIRSISLIHQQLYQDEQMTAIEFSKFAKDLLYQVTSVFKKPGQNVALQNEIPELFLDIDTAVPLGLILNELMTNSYKYAFAGDKDGSIQIKLESTGGSYKLVYGDSGPGLPENYDMSMSGTLGMMVIDSLSKQLGGYFEYDKWNKKFVITFKDINERKKVA